jgi:PAS domain S-box-containing protein
MSEILSSIASLLDSVTDPAVVVAVPGYEIVLSNRAFLGLAGETMGAITGRRCYEVIHRLDVECEHDGENCPARKAVATGAHATSFHVHKYADGTETMAEVGAVPIRNEDGDIGWVIETTRSVRSRHDREEEVQRKSEFLESILHTCPEGIVGNDPEGNIFLFNSSAERLFGYLRKDVIGRIQVRDIYPPGEARTVREFLDSEEFGGRGRLVDFETTVLGRDGRRIPIRLCCSLVHENGKETGIIGFFTDISAQKALKERFLESEERYRGIFESAHDAMVSFDGNGRVTVVNRAAETGR